MKAIWAGGEMAATGLGSVVSVSPGRVRLRVARPHRTPRFFSEVRTLLAGLPGVSTVEVNPTSGSVLIVYDPATLDVAQLLRLGSELGWIPQPAGDETGLSFAGWWRQVDLGRVAEGVAVLGIAGLGAVAGPAVGVSARIGSLSAAAGFLALRRFGRRIRLAP